MKFLDRNVHKFMKKLSSKEMAAACKSRGIKLEPGTVRKWWRDGAPRDDVDEFVKFYTTQRTRHGDIKKSPKTAVFDLLDALRKFQNPEEIDAKALALVTDLESEGGDLVGLRKDKFLLVMSVRRMVAFQRYAAVFAGSLEMALRPSTVPEELRAGFADFYETGIDWPVMMRELGLSGIAPSTPPKRST